MSCLVVSGGKCLGGEITVQGAKNAVLPILAATIMSGGKNVIYNCPDLSDVNITIQILENLGCKVTKLDNTLVIDSDSISQFTIPDSLMRQMRSSVIFLGAIISRFHKAVISMPGGCEIGNRPIDLHLKSLKLLGVQIFESHGYINCSCDKLEGANIHLDFPSVGATENIMLCASTATGITKISNCAREPEIIDLQNFLNRMGAKITGAGTNEIVIEGVEHLYSVEHTIMPDRICAATYLSAVAITNGDVILKNVESKHMGAMLSVLSEMGCKIYCENNRIVLKSPKKRLNAVPRIVTMPYPGFPTDIQSPFMALSCVADGTSVFVENIFENRYKHVEELIRMGANINVDSRIAVVQGVNRLSGADVFAQELRGGASLVIAGLAADGETRIHNVSYIDRGYERIEYFLSNLGANIRREE